MDTLEAIRTKRSIRQFTADPVPEDLILKILDAGRHAQSSKNDQPWTFILIRERERLKAVSKCGKFAGHLAGAAFAVVLVDHHNWSFDIGQAAAYLQLAAWELGVSSCLAYFGLQDELKALLGIPAEANAEIALSFGYSAEEPRAMKKKGRKSLDEILRREHFYAQRV
jgi:nitroreductase